MHSLRHLICSCWSNTTIEWDLLCEKTSKLEASIGVEKREGLLTRQSAIALLRCSSAEWRSDGGTKAVRTDTWGKCTKYLSSIFLRTIWMLRQSLQPNGGRMCTNVCLVTPALIAFISLLNVATTGKWSDGYSLFS